MKCEACGGDGQIEYGAYRGDQHDTNTRQCPLCGGVVTVDIVKGAPTTTARKIGIESQQNHSSVKSKLSEAPKSTHEHVWGEPQAFDDWRRRVSIRCRSCKADVVFDSAGNLTLGKVSESELNDLAQRARLAWLAYKARCRGDDRV